MNPIEKIKTTARRVPNGARPFIIVAALIGVGGAYTAATSADAAQQQDIPTGPPSAWEIACPGTARLVTYTGTGTGYARTRGVSYTAQTSDGTSQGDTDVPITNKSGSLGLQWCAPVGEFVYFSVQNNGQTGSVTCGIEVDGRAVAANTSYGGYAVVSCDGRA